MELDHLRPRAEGGPDEIENAIPVCFDCHAEIHAYNPQHPRGRKFTAGELLRHKAQWLEICANRPEVFTEPSREADVGPVQALIDELEFNRFLASELADPGQVPPRYLTDQFRRAIAAGSVALLRDEIKGSVLRAYADIEIGNAAARYAEADRGETRQGARGAVSTYGKRCLEAAHRIKVSANTARSQLLRFLGADDGRG